MSEIKKLQENINVKRIDENTVLVHVAKNEIMMALAGEFNENFKLLEKVTKTTIFSRGNNITGKGKSENLVVLTESIKFLVNKFLVTNVIEKNDITYSTNQNLSESNSSNIKHMGQMIKTPRRSIIARSKKQSDYIKAIQENDIVMALGPAGTGKSFLAVSVGISLLMEKKIERVILSRPAVEAGEKLGFLPGDMKEKVDPYLRPLYDALYDLFGYEKIQKKIDSGEIEIAPLAFMRGEL